MRKLAILSAIVIAAAAITATSCENVFHDAMDKYSGSGIIYLFVTSKTFTGDAIGGRDGADAKCQAEYDANHGDLGANNVRAFINVTDTDEIQNMPENFGVPTDAPIYGPNGVLIDYDWASLLDGAGILPTGGLVGAGLTSTGYYWTGEQTTPAGYGVIYPGYNCSEWTSAGSGIAGAAVDSTALWLGSGTQSCTGYSGPILCIAW